MLELELKAVVSDADALRERLHAAGATALWRGRLHDRRYDRDGMLRAHDEVLRVRREEPIGGEPREELGWKGPTGLRDGYKAREELTARLAVGDSVVSILEALGYHLVHAIDRHVEVYHLAGATLRIEWYPELDTLIEVEGAPEAIEQAIAASGIARSEFRAEALDGFAARFEARTGRPARVRLDPDEEPTAWPT